GVDALHDDDLTGGGRSRGRLRRTGVGGLGPRRRLRLSSRLACLTSALRSGCGAAGCPECEERFSRARDPHPMKGGAAVQSGGYQTLEFKVILVLAHDGCPLSFP